MRLPGRGDPDTQPKSEASHYMVDFYAGKEKFNLPIIPFINECEFGYYKFYGTEQITMKGIKIYNVSKTLIYYQCYILFRMEL